MTVLIDRYCARFYCLSANRSVVAVCSRQGNSQPQNGIISTDNLKINSAGNQIVVCGLNEDFGNESQFGAVRSLFLYVGSTNEWVKHGDCTFSPKKAAYYGTAIPSNGLVVAVTELSFDSPSFVKI